MNAAGERTRLERAAHLMGLIGITLLAIVSVVDGALRGDITDSIPTVVLAAAFAVAWFLGRPRITTLAWTCVVGAFVGGMTIDAPVIRVGGYIGMVSLAAVLATFARRQVRLTVITVSGVAALAPLLWEGSLRVSLIMMSACAVSGLLIAGLRAEIESALSRSRRVLELAPVPIMEQDWSRVERALDGLRADGVQDLNTYFDANPNAVVELLGEVRVTSANAATVDSYRAASKDDVFDRFNTPAAGPPVVNELSYAEYRRHLLDLWEGRLTQDTEIPTFDVHGGRLWGRVRWTRDPDDPGSRIVGVADITELKLIQDQLEETNRSKDRFIASVSHELRTPLAAVVGFANELLDAPEKFGADERRELLQLVRDEAQEVANIIEDLLVAARADMGGIVVMHDAIDLATVVDQLQRTLPADLAVDVATDLPEVCGDVVRVKQVIRNLVTNAHRYGGPNRSMSVVAGDGGVVVEVADDGDSLREEDLARIFDPYTRAHTPLGTTDSVGLGLTVSRLLAEMMGGSLSASRHDGRTVFRLVLPTPTGCGPADGRTRLREAQR